MDDEREYEFHDPSDLSMTVREPACELLAYMLADHQIESLLTEHKLPGIDAEYREVRETRCIRLLVELATIYRLTSWKLDKAKRLSEATKEVGIYFEGDDADGVPLSLHEACNKIIHADEIGFERVALRERKGSHVTDQIFAAGTRGKTEWTVGIWVPEFCDGILTMEVVNDIPW